MKSAITTKYHGPSNVKGSRVSARCERGSVTVPWDYALSTAENHRNAAHRLCMEMHREAVRLCLPQWVHSDWLQPFVSGWDYAQNGQHVFNK